MQLKPLGYHDGHVYWMHPNIAIRVSMPSVHPEIDNTVHTSDQCTTVKLRTTVHKVLNFWQVWVGVAGVKQRLQSIRHVTHHFPVVWMLIGIVCHCGGLVNQFQLLHSLPQVIVSNVFVAFAHYLKNDGC